MYENVPNASTSEIPFSHKNRNKKYSSCVFVLLFTVSLLLEPFGVQLKILNIDKMASEIETRTYFVYFHTFSYKFKVQGSPTESACDKTCKFSINDSNDVCTSLLLCSEKGGYYGF